MLLKDKIVLVNFSVALEVTKSKVIKKHLSIMLFKPILILWNKIFLRSDWLRKEQAVHFNKMGIKMGTKMEEEHHRIKLMRMDMRTNIGHRVPIRMDINKMVIIRITQVDIKTINIKRITMGSLPIIKIMTIIRTTITIKAKSITIKSNSNKIMEEYSLDAFRSLYL
jgi:hypothetical protein